MLNLFIEQFQLKNFQLSNENGDLFVQSRWQDPSKIKVWYFVYRWFLAAYHTCWWIYLFLTNEGLGSPWSAKVYFFIYLTNWSYTVITLMNIYWACVETKVATKYYYEGLISRRMGASLRVLWVVQNLTYMPATLVTAVYWVFLFNGSGLALRNAEVHMLNTIYSLVELLVSATPIRLYHVYHPVAYLLVYVLFSLFYYLAGGTTSDGLHYIYPILDWEDVPSTMKSIGFGAIASFILQFLVWCIYCLRELVYRKWWVRNFPVEDEPQLRVQPYNGAPFY